MGALVNSLFTASGRPEQGDNRSKYVKALESMLSEGYIKIEIQELGKVWTTPKHVDAGGKLVPFTVEMRGYGYVRRLYVKSFDAKDLLLKAAKFLASDNLKDKHTEARKAASSSISFDVAEPCSRCSGAGFIRAFNYYCDGLCFSCCGAGYKIKKRSIKL